MTMEWGQVAALLGVVFGGIGLLWKVRKDELDDLKTQIAAKVDSSNQLLASQVQSLHAEITALRDWRHDFAPMKLVYDDYGRRITVLEDRMSRSEARSRVREKE